MEYFIIGFLIGQNIVTTLVFGFAYFSLRNKVDAEVALIWTKLNGLTRTEHTVPFDPNNTPYFIVKGVDSDDIFMTAFQDLTKQELLNHVETEESDSSN